MKNNLKIKMINILLLVSKNINSLYGVLEMIILELLINVKLEILINKIYKLEIF